MKRVGYSALGQKTNYTFETYFYVLQTTFNTVIYVKNFCTLF